MAASSLRSIGDDDEENEISEEIELLQAIYIHELKLDGSRMRPAFVTLFLHPSTGDDDAIKYVCLNLCFSIPPKYPFVPPGILIKNPRGLSDAHLNSIQENLVALAKEKIGAPMLYDLIEYAKDCLSDNNIPSCPCAICLEPFKKEEKFVKTECYHYFHSFCLLKYIQHVLVMDENSKILCPMCRLEIICDMIGLHYGAQNCSCEDEIFLYKPDKKELEAQAERQRIFDYQKQKGGIIDVEQERNKFLIGIKDTQEEMTNSQIPKRDLTCCENEKSPKRIETEELKLSWSRREDSARVRSVIVSKDDWNGSDDQHLTGSYIAEDGDGHEEVREAQIRKGWRSKKIFSDGETLEARRGEERQNRLKKFSCQERDVSDHGGKEGITKKSSGRTARCSEVCLKSRNPVRKNNSCNFNVTSQRELGQNKTRREPSRRDKRSPRNVSPCSRDHNSQVEFPVDPKELQDEDYTVVGKTRCLNEELQSAEQNSSKDSHSRWRDRTDEDEKLKEFSSKYSSRQKETETSWQRKKFMTKNSFSDSSKQTRDVSENSRQLDRTQKAVSFTKPRTRAVSRSYGNKSNYKTSKAKNFRSEKNYIETSEKGMKVISADEQTSPTPAQETRRKDQISLKPCENVAANVDKVSSCHPPPGFEDVKPKNLAKTVK